jgi:aspartate/methionine/tyrosine aminotransferase
MNLSKRLENFDSTVFQQVLKWHQELKNPIDLSLGIPEDMTPEYIKNAGIQAIKQDFTTYRPAAGIKELREALADKFKKFNGIETRAEDITICPGLTCGILLTYMAILDPGDEIIIMDPCYPPYKHLATAIGAVPVWLSTYPSFQLDLDEIEASITHKTKAIFINTPNNPSGAIYPKKDLLKLADIAERNNVLILSDEIYESFTYDDEHFSIGSVYPNTVTMGGFSKEYSMTGWRLGYMCGPPKVIAAIDQLQQYVVFSSTSISQYAALEALQHPLPTRDKYKKKRDLLVNGLRDAGYKVEGAQGSYYIMIKAPHDMTDLEFAERAAEHNLIIIPGRAFSDRHGYVRLSYGNTYEQVKKGLEIIKKLT